jgi:putative drug exporter of the RND superfamily
MTLMGRAAWWLPSWLDRILPPISIEGGDYFDRRDAEQRAPEPVATG